MIVNRSLHRCVLNMFQSLSIADAFRQANNRWQCLSTMTYQQIKTLNKCGDYQRAFHIFDVLMKRNQLNVITLLTIIETCARSTNVQRGEQIERLINQSTAWKDDRRLQTSLINMFMSCQKIDPGRRSIDVDGRHVFMFRLAERIFERIRHSTGCDTVVYNAMLVRLFVG
jgi:hypothetical protein